MPRTAPNQEFMPRGLVTIKSASEIIGVSVETLRQWDRRGKLKAIRDKSNGYRLYSISALEYFMRINGLKHPGIRRFKLTN